MIAKVCRTMTFYRVALCAIFLLLLFLTQGQTVNIAPVACVLILGLSAGLAFLRDTRRLTLPFLLLTLLLIFCYDSFKVFIGYIWVAPFVLAAAVVHILRLKPRFKKGESFWGLVAVAVATLLGGIGMIPAGDYFRPAALGYALALGPGLVLVYLLMKNEMKTAEDEESFMADIAAWSLTAAVVVFGRYLVALPAFFESGSFGEPPQWSNNIATMLMLSFPVLFVYAKRHYLWLLAGFFAAGAAIFSGSNGGLLFATVELLVCLLYLWLSDKRPIHRLWTRTIFLFCVFFLVAVVYYVFSRHLLGVGELGSISKRLALLWRGFENFVENPLFGSGLGYLGNADLYSGKVGTINWYHVFIAQVVGGLGLVGVAAWGYQLFLRARLALREVRGEGFAPALCYLGLLLMSQVNPGEFCPVPYAFLAVTYFVFLENRHEAAEGRVASA